MNAAFLCILTQIGFSVAAVAAPTPVPSPTPIAPSHRIRPSQIRGKPMPTPSPRPPRVRGVRTKPKNTTPILIAPKPVATAKPAIPPSTFEISKSSKPGKLVLKYKANVSNLDFDTRAPFVIQLVPQGTLKVTPLVVTRSDWPKTGPQQIELSYSGADSAKVNTIIGKAAYTVCVHQTKECRKQKVPIVFHFH
jgi:hypothetical protein